MIISWKLIARLADNGHKKSDTSCFTQ
jgi:hypothetical protein